GDDRLGLEHSLARIERERALVLAVGVALGAAGLDHRDDVVREVDWLAARPVSPRHRRRPSDQAEARPGHGPAPSRPGSTATPALLDSHRLTPRMVRMWWV